MKSTRSGILTFALVANCAALAFPAHAEVALPDCIAGNYDAVRHLFTLRNPKPDQPSQQCLLTVSAPGEPPSATRIPAGSYVINLSDGGDGGAGGTVRAANVRGGGASTKSEGGDGGGDLRRHWSQPPERGLLGSGGGGGEGTPYTCGAGGRGGDGFMALRIYQPRSADASDQTGRSGPERSVQ